MENWIDLIVTVLSTLLMIVPLVIKLVEYVQKAIKEKNWKDLLELVTNLMKEAEGKFDNGNDRKEWVLTCVKATADTINYDIDMDVVGKLIDDLCAMSKIVNAPKEENTEVEPEVVAEA